jgi:hypothetical protein
MLLFFNIRPAMISKHSELTKRHVRDCYRRFASPSSRTAPPPSHQEVGSSSHYRTAPPPSREEEASSDDSAEMWVVALPLTHLVAPPPPTRLEEASSGDSPSSSSGYNNEWPHVKEVSSYELLLDFNYVV